MAEEQRAHRELEDRVTLLENTITDLMDIIHDHYQLKDAYSGGDAELRDVIKKFQGEK